VVCEGCLRGGLLTPSVNRAHPVHVDHARLKPGERGANVEGRAVSLSLVLDRLTTRSTLSVRWASVPA
jgi:hypothetical protein